MNIRRYWLFAAALILGVLVNSSAAPASVDMSVGLRYVIPNGSQSECSAKAKTALNKYLQNATESAPGSGEWVAFGPAGAAGPPTSSATVRCNPVDKGYVVTFTCAVQWPGSPYGANALCLDVAHNFSGKAESPLPTPTPVPTGCNTANLVGTWTSSGREKPGMTFKMTINGDLTDSDGISGNWILNGTTATLTYYGNHTLKLSPDGKTLNGDGYTLTRKC
jgi:hypothetical protein